MEPCEFRQQLSMSDGSAVSVCGLAHRLGGAQDGLLAIVQPDACLACAESFPPSEDAINPVVASLLYRMARDIASRGGVPGCDMDRAEQLRRMAFPHLAVVPGTPPRSPLVLIDRSITRCASLGEPIGSAAGDRPEGVSNETRFSCSHPRYHETTLRQCLLCRDWSLTPGSVAPAIRELIPPSPRFGAPIRRWAVGMTTAPRRTTTLDVSLDSLIRAGWDRPRLFVDGAVPIAARHADLPVTLREPRVGAWANFYLALTELAMREPNADAYLLVQDDVLFDDRHDLRAYLESALWPADPIGAVSLYCSSVYTQAAAGWHRHSGGWQWGALALVFPRESVKLVLSDPAVLEHRWSDPSDKLARIDHVIGEWSDRSGLPIYFPTPSLAQHIGEVSAIWDFATTHGARRADRFAGDIQ